MTPSDPYELERFVTAQAPAFSAVTAELRAGRKSTHWMWFVFPQLRDLGHSRLAQLYGIGSPAEARAYLAHPVLGPRLELCTRLVRAIENGSIGRILGPPDDLKFCSSMTLFALAAPQPRNLFQEALDRFCGGGMDERTLALLPRVDA